MYERYGDGDESPTNAATLLNIQSLYQQTDQDSRTGSSITITPLKGR